MPRALVLRFEAKQARVGRPSPGRLFLRGPENRRLPLSTERDFLDYSEGRPNVLRDDHRTRMRENAGGNWSARDGFALDTRLLDMARLIEGEKHA